MSRQKSDKRIKAYEMYKSSNGSIKLKDIAAALGVSDTQVRKWKNQDKWDKVNGENKVTLPNTKGNVIKQKRLRKPKKDPVKKKNDSENEAPELTEKQVLFVAEYLTDFNATRAAMAVGYSKRSAYSIGWENLRKPEIQAEIKRQTEIVTVNLGITSQRVLLEYLKIAFADMGNYVDFGQKDILVGVNKKGDAVTRKVNYLDFKDSSEVDGTLIKEVKQGKDGVAIKFHDKMKALEKLEKYLDLLPDQHKRRIEEEKLKLAQEQFEFEKGKNTENDEPIEIVIKRKGEG